MRIRIGRRRPTSDAALAVPVAVALERLRDTQASGCLTVSHGPSGSNARVFVLAGAVYAVALEHYDFPIALRLCSSALLDEDACAAIAMTIPREHPDFGRVAVSTGRLDVADLGRLHQELVLAAAGAVLAVDFAVTYFEPDIVTGDFCTMPIGVDALVEMVSLRRERQAAGWQVVTADADPSDCIVAATGRALPDDACAPELTAMLGALDGVRTVDQAAAACGFTRAEAVHLACALVAGGHASVSEGVGEPSRGLDVPEAFGRPVTVDEPAHAPALELGEPDAPDEPTAQCAVVDLDAQALTALVIDGTVVLHPAVDIDGEIELLRRELADAEEQASVIRARLQQALERHDVHVH
ncbi:MAG: hypothetical protein PHU75_01930 [Candidatus Nanopelagicales bacterium]|nr:hypothetical protein [Candidatus Nanopelagicales bacterium]